MSKGWGDLYLELEHAITEIDLELHQWQEDLDMMSFIYVDASFELWTNDDPPRLVTPAVLSQAAGKELRVMHIVEGKPTQVGTAVVNSDGILEASIDKEVPGLTNVGPMAFSVRNEEMWKPLPSERALLPKPIAHFTMRKDGSVFDNFAGEEIVAPLKKRFDIETVVEDAINNVERNYEFKHRSDLDNHPFFRNWSDPENNLDKGN